MAITKIILQQMVTMDQNSITASKYPKYTIVLGNTISSITAGELTSAIESSKASAAAAKQSEINAKQSELNAKDSENEAEISAASSQQSATQSASSATASANSAKAAKTSETNAKASETAAKTSETNAKASETAAKTSETNANSSKTAAAASASAAKTSETNAAASASAAKISETNANNSKTAAANSASAAKTSETNAAASAKTSETNAVASAESASDSKASRDEAGTFATQATNAATAARESQTSANNSANIASQAVTTIQGLKDTAVSAASQAETSAREASTHAGAASSSAAAAKTEAGKAKTEADRAKVEADRASANSYTITFTVDAGWFKLATVTMPQATSTVSIKMVGGNGYNVGNPQQAGITELVLRAGNGKPKGLSGSLWRRTTEGFSSMAWINTSGNVYDVYVEIGRYADKVNIQVNYTTNASVVLHSQPQYYATKPEGLTTCTIYDLYNPLLPPPDDGTSLKKAQNLSDLPDKSQSRTNLGLDRFRQLVDAGETQVKCADGTKQIFIKNTGDWGAWDSSRGLSLALPITQGGTGADTLEGARYNLGVDRLFQNSGETVLYSPNKNKYLTIPDGGDRWGVYDATTNQWLPLGIQSGGTGAKDANGIRNNIGLGEKHAPKFLSLNVENETGNAATANAGIYHSKLKNTQGEDIGSSQSYFETQVGVGKHTIGVFHNGLSQYYQFDENGAFSGAKRISLAPGAGFYADGNERNASQLFSIMNPPINTWTGVSRYNWYDDYAIAGLIRRDDTHVESFGIELYQAGIQSYMHKFYPDGRTHSAQYTGKTQQMGWDDPNYWGNALVWGEIIPNNDVGWAPGLSWGTQSTGGYPIRATWGLIPQGNNAWPFCSLRLRGNGNFFCNFQFQPASNDITTWSSSGNFIFQKAANSDRDLKHDIIYTDGKESYDRVMQWLPTMFKYNGSNIQRFGLIAQDLLKIDPEYVKLIPGGDIFADVIGVNEEGEEYVDRQIVVDTADDTLALDNNVIMADLACAFRYQADKVNKLEQELTELKKLVSELIKPDNS